MYPDKICGQDYQQFLIQMEEFHGGRSGGMLIGALLLEAALDRIGMPPDLAVVAETVNCLPDAVQVLSPCTVGNGLLHILNWGKFALTAYRQERLVGVRARLSTDAVPDWPDLNRWFNRLEPEKEPPVFDDLAKELFSGRDQLIEAFDIHLPGPMKEEHPVDTGACPQCSESCPIQPQPLCEACQGTAYYRPHPNTDRC